MEGMLPTGFHSSAELNLLTRKTCSPGDPLNAPLMADQDEAIFACGCFWGAEKGSGGCLGWSQQPWAMPEGNGKPSYNQVCPAEQGIRKWCVSSGVACSRLQRPAEIVLGMPRPNPGESARNDTGSQYRSAIYTCNPEHLQLALASKDAYQAALSAKGYGSITTEILADQPFYFARTITSNTSPNQAAALTARDANTDAAWRLRRRQLQTPEAGLDQVRLVHQSLRASIR